ncbi:zinc-finger domain-containing protein [Brackiella oedipodis]|uniref:zinc-finger domain-containing protein n=1 Tax=Brackiella oedipodis TaxID=124225 RepID=UPI000490CEA1|nr:zinc-finger domain-containing protein [Brackiella oedipodis]
MSNSDTKNNQEHQRFEVSASDLPVYCPGPQSPRWSMHPRVFLDVATSGQAQCPYCGAVYALKAGEVVHSH